VDLKLHKMLFSCSLLEIVLIFEMVVQLIIPIVDSYR